MNIVFRRSRLCFNSSFSSFVSSNSTSINSSSSSFFSSRCFSCSTASVFSFGDNSHGALGLPTLVPHAYEPTRIPGLPPNLSAVAAGHYHSLALTSEGHLWAWGRDHEAQLGRGSPSPRDSWNHPKRVEGLDQVRVKAASASGVVSSAIGEDGSLWVWGKSNRGQLGLGKGVTEAMLPSKVEALAGEDIVKVSLSILMDTL